MIKLLRNQQEKILELDANLNALRLVVGRSLNLSPEDMSKSMSDLRSQFRDLEEDRAGREQVDAMIKLLESGKDPSQRDS
jgi:hypothetical protein